jgi:MOSC domain
VHQTPEQLEAGLGLIREAPAEEGTLELIVRRPVPEERELLEVGELDAEVGLVGDGWSERPSSKTGRPNPEAQVTVTSARAIALVAGGREPEAWAPAGDQLYVDLDISQENLPPGARFAVGEAVLEVSEAPHTGCGKYVRRFGVDAMKFVNSDVGRSLRLRGLNARVVTPGTVRPGDPVRRL